MDQPRSMLCRKLERNFIEEDFWGSRLYLVAELLWTYKYLILFYINGNSKSYFKFL